MVQIQMGPKNHLINKRNIQIMKRNKYISNQKDLIANKDEIQGEKKRWLELLITNCPHKRQNKINIKE